jgi:hypothetical protein
VFWELSPAALRGLVKLNCSVLKKRDKGVKQY